MSVHAPAHTCKHTHAHTYTVMYHYLEKNDVALQAYVHACMHAMRCVRACYQYSEKFLMWPLQDVNAARWSDGRLTSLYLVPR